MVSFSCEGCGDVLTKKKLDPHRNRCRGATFTCIDCMVHFPGTEYRSHTSCMSEEQKYQGALYKNKKAKTNNHKTNDTAFAAASINETTYGAQKPAMSQQAYVEAVPEGFADYEYEDLSEDGKSPAEMPEAPTPPPAAPEAPINVFDFLDPSATPNASTLQIASAAANEETQLVRYEGNDQEEYLDASGYMVDEDPNALVQYGSGAINTAAHQTPAPREHRRKTGTELKKDKKRKRLHLDTDQIMADAPPVLHSGLTGGLNRMMAPMFPPSPDYSGGDGADPSPASPLKKKKHSKKHGKRESSLGSGLLALMGGGSSKSKSKKRKVSSSSTKKTSSSHRHRRSHSDAEKPPKLIEYRPHSQGDDKEGADAENQMIVFRPRADLLLSFVDKGPESERGYSMKKALRHFHRERTDSADSLGKSMEEKELWRSLRMRKNDRGEIVLFGL